MDHPGPCPAPEVTLRALTKDSDRLALFVEALLALGDGDFDSEFLECIEILRGSIPIHSAEVYLKRGSTYVHYRSLSLSKSSTLAPKTSPLDLPEEPPGLASRVYWGPAGFGLVPETGHDAKFGEPLILRLTANDALIGAILLTPSEGKSFSPADRDFFVLLQPKLSSALSVSLAFRKLESDAMMDPVTDTLNSRAILRRLEDEIQRAQREHRTVGLLFIDLNDLKAINDSHGHAAGDEVLRQAASAMAASMRGYDALGRIGGDEFLAILPGLDSDGIEARIRLLKQEAAKTSCVLPDGVELTPGLSIGGAVFPIEAADSKALIALSDSRMYKDKVRYRNRSSAGEAVPAEP